LLKFVIFGINLPERVYALKRFFFKLSEGGYLKSVPSGQISLVSLLKCGLITPKIAETGNFWYKFAQKGYTPLSDFYKIWLKGGRLRFAPSCQIVPLSVNKIWEYSPQNRQNWYFLYKFAQKWYTPLSHFYNILPGGESPRTAPSMPNFTVIALKMWPYGPKNR